MGTEIVIVKIGTQILTTLEGSPDLNNLRNLVAQICEDQQANRRFVIVTSGAITCGSSHLGITAKSIPEKQAAAAIGQILLLQHYFQFFQSYGRKIAQILLTRDALENQDRSVHAHNTIETLLAHSIIPIINENDTVAIDEIKFGDNDQLSSMVARLIQAKSLLLLTDIDGLFSANPNKDPNAKLIPRVTDVDTTIFSYIEDVDNGRSRGGMQSKINAAKLAQEQGIDVYIANGRRKNVIRDILAGQSVGTHVVAKAE